MKTATKAAAQRTTSRVTPIRKTKTDDRKHDSADRPSKAAKAIERRPVERWEDEGGSPPPDDPAG